jgi:UDPglucose 6-dehydrogenase
MRVAMIGAGYVGLVSGACFADFGHEVCCVDKDPRKIEALNRGEIPIFEPGLPELVAKSVREGRLTFNDNLAVPVRSADAVFIAVGTPSRRGRRSRGPVLRLPGRPRDRGGARRLYRGGDEIDRAGRAPATRSSASSEVPARREFAVVSNPEFLREGAAIADFKRPDRIVLGTDDERAADVMRELYRPLYLNQAPILVTSRRTRS